MRANPRNRAAFGDHSKFFRFFLARGSDPLERGSCFNASGTIPAMRVVSNRQPWSDIASLQRFVTTALKLNRDFLRAPIRKLGLRRREVTGVSSVFSFSCHSLNFLQSDTTEMLRRNPV